MLSENVPIDPCFGLGQMGIYQEALERTLESLGLSMIKDQEVNTSIDGEAVRRALIPGHLLNASHWLNQMKQEKRRDEILVRVANLRAEANALKNNLRAAAGVYD
jgi:hypothetical protein